MSRPTLSSDAEALCAHFCGHCALIEQRRQGKCPKGQTTCGAQIDKVYTLKQSYAGLPAVSLVHIKDIFWSLDKDYATVTIVTTEGQRFGVAWTLLDPDVPSIFELPMQDGFQWLSERSWEERGQLFERGLEILLQDVQHGPRRRTLPGRDLLGIGRAPRLPIPLTPRTTELLQEIKALTEEDDILTSIRAIYLLMRYGIHEQPGQS
ncbi:MAG: hypothetical protein AB1489_02220 [Acidobacteriota bacterium]